ncbi:MAG: DUF4339 domain-containing protein [Akkermansia sp.]|nr:DUF4339 domain-containing protein [Akkermansia sp.]
MRYYYSIKGEAKGPVEEEELDALAEEGVIKTNTPVIEVGGKEWSRYSSLRPGKETIPQPPPIQKTSVMEKLFYVNTWVDKVIAKIFRFPSFIPKDYEGRMQGMEKMANVTALAIWVSAIFAGMGVGSASGEAGGLVGGAIGGVIYGFVAQYIAYQFYLMLNSLIIGQPVVLSSSRFPKLMGILMTAVTLIVAIATLAMAAKGGVGGILLALCAVLPCVVLIYLCMNAEGVLVRVSPGEVSPGREFNNCLKFNVRAICAAVHLLTPVISVLAALSLFFTTLSMHSGSGGLASLGILTVAGPVVVGLIHLPIVTWLFLCLSSWLLDLLDSIFSLGGVKK